MQALGFAVPQDKGIVQISAFFNPVASELEHSSNSTVLQSDMATPWDSVNEPVDNFDNFDN